MKVESAERFERGLGNVLHVGSIASTIMLTAGLALSLGDPESWLGMLFLRAGLVVLMATPAARVVVSVFEYWARRDWAFVMLTMSVLVVLLGSLLVALAG